MFELLLLNNSYDYNEFLSFLTFLKTTNPFFIKFQTKILAMIDTYTSILEIWHHYFFLIDFNYQEYLEFVNKITRNTNTNTNNYFINELLCYNIFFFTIVTILSEKILEYNNIVHTDIWIKKQIFIEEFLFKDPEFEEELISYLKDKIKSIDMLIKYNIDIIKILYEELIPAKYRKLLGEFYTPDWLINLMLKDLDIKNQKFIDPASGSASFLKRILDEILSNSIIDVQTAINTALDKIIGFDINVFTVQIGRLNVLLSLRNILNLLTNPVVMPIYFADSLFYPFTAKDSPLLKDFLLTSKNPPFVNFSRVNLKRKIDINDINLSDPSFCVYEDLNTNLSHISDKLEKEFLIGNYLAYNIEKRDIAIGNPPWLAWDGINSGYRNILSSQWKFLFTQQGWRAKIAAGRVDLSAMFVYSSAMYFVKEKTGKIIYVLPLSLFKSQSAGEGFRKFKSNRGIFSPTKVWDFSRLAIFPKATNQAIVVFFEIGKELSLPIPWSVFVPKNMKKIPRDFQGNDFVDYIEKQDMLGQPISKTNYYSPWVSITKDQVHIIKKMEGKSFYRARGGINTGGANTIFWIKVLQQEDAFYHVQNIGTSLRTKVQIIQAKIEKQLVYKLIRGRDVKQWYYTTDLFIILPYDPQVDSKVAIPEQKLKNDYPLTYDFLNCFYPQLTQRKEFKRWNEKGSFYELYRIGPYTFSPYKVIWQHTGLNKQMKACVLATDQERLAVDQKIIFVSFNNEDEAHYFCAIINSEIVFTFLHSYLMLDASTHILEHLAIPEFNHYNPTHLELAQLSKICHHLVKSLDDRTKHEDKINILVKSLFSL